MRRRTSWLSALTGILFIALALMAQQLSEAPAGFDTPTVVDNPGSQSISNGLPEPPGDTFALDQQRLSVGTILRAGSVLCSTRPHVPSATRTA